MIGQATVRYRRVEEVGEGREYTLFVRNCTFSRRKSRQKAVKIPERALFIANI